jgi:glycosyltransferase involved in cell wall biosynthesis
VLGVPAKMVVVVPARNEEHRLRACLTALRSSIRHLRGQVAATPDVRVVLVLDRCTDRSAAVAASWSGLDVIVTEHGRVGAARATGVRHTLAIISAPARKLWGSRTPTLIQQRRPDGC